jgi:hypothetical protein
MTTDTIFSWKKWVNFEPNLRRACRDYAGVSTSRSKYYLQLSTCRAAISLLNEVMENLEKRRQDCFQVKSRLLSVSAKLNEPRVKPSAAGSDPPFEVVLSFSPPEQVGSDGPAVEGLLKVFRTRFGSLVKIADHQDAEIAELMEEFAREHLNGLASFYMESLMGYRSTDDSGGFASDLRKLSDLALPLWCINDWLLPLPHHTLQELVYCGVEDSEQTLLKHEEHAQRLANGGTVPVFVSTGDAERVVLLKIRAGAPLFALEGIEEMHRAYRSAAKLELYHLHRNWKDLPDVKPPEISIGRSVQWFAVGSAPVPFNLIQCKNSRYFFVEEKSLEVSLDNSEAGRFAALLAFERRPDLVRKVQIYAEKAFREHPEKALSSLKAHRDNLHDSKLPQYKSNTATHDLILAEIRALENLILRLSREA